MFFVFKPFHLYVAIRLLVISISSSAQVLRNNYADIYNDKKYRQNPSGFNYAPGGIYNWDRYQFSNARSIISFGDSRCDIGKNPYDVSSSSVPVQLRLGTVVGMLVPLCDGPGVPEFERPFNRPNFIPQIFSNVTLFLGIPYAVPPINDRRFKPPQIQPSFHSITAKQFKSSCPQSIKYTGPRTGIDFTSEDCLYLNVYSPSVTRQDKKYAVMVYIHGGAWDHGSANTFPAHMMSASQGVVVVTFNYRLGPFGFYANGQNSSAGNFGLLDQAMAIEWVYDNIDVFNGDNQKITLFGPGVGAASAGILALSSRLGKKIRRVIAQSGAAVAEWAVLSDNYTIYNNSLKYAELFNCQFESSWRTVKCLSGVSLARLQRVHFEPYVGWYAWSPVVDHCTRDLTKQILPDVPENLIKNHYENLHEDFEYMTGVTKDEALYMLLDDSSSEENNFKVSKEIFKRKIWEYSALYNFTLDIPALSKAIEFMYFPRLKDVDNETLLREGYMKMLSDSYYKAPMDKMVKLLLTRNIKTYMYVLNSTLDGLKYVKSYKYNKLKNVVPHNTEYFYVTGAPFMDPDLFPKDLELKEAKWTEADRNMSQFFMTAWANFAKFGNPTPFKLFENILWQPTTLRRMEYLSINTTNFTTVMMSDYQQRESEFWNNYIHQLMRKDSFPATYCHPVYEKWEDEKRIYVASLWGVLAAVGLFLVLSVLCCCLYCKAKSKHIVSSEDIPDAISVTPSSVDTLLNMKRVDVGNKYLSERLHGEHKHTQV